MHVFGYGSLMWKQGFEYEHRICGYIKGFKRRFWQGSEDHRGQPGKPGRVLSVLKSEDPEDIVLGVAFKISKENEKSVRELLIDRETGYDIIQTVFYPESTSSDINKDEPIALEIFVANQEIPTYLGPASEKDIAWQIYHAQGLVNTNLDYLLRVIWISKKLFPAHTDHHLELLEQEVKKIALQKGESLDKYQNFDTS